MPPRISVVIPIFNTGAYLEKCVRSVQEQTFEDIEIICVDDNSPDDSASLIEKISRTDNRLKLIRHPKNLGQGGARNTAIQTAQGAYIANVDSDDWLDPKMLEQMYAATMGESVDIVCCGFKRITEAGKILREWSGEEGLHDNRQFEKNIFELVNPAIWNKLFKKQLCINGNINFPNYLCYEDLATTPRLLAESNSIHIIEDRLYNYVSRENSVVSTYSPKHMLDCFEAIGVLHKYLVKKDLMDRYEIEFHKMMHKNIKFQLNVIQRAELTEEQILYHLRYYYFIKSNFLEHIQKVQSMSKDELIESVLQSSLDDSMIRKRKVKAA